MSLRQRRYSLVASILLVIAILLQGTGAVLAGTTATINGTVTDVSGAPISGVSVTAKSPSGTYRAKTDAHGYYSMAGVAPDTYTVSFEDQGFQTASQTGVVAFADQSVGVNARLAKELKTIARINSRAAGGAFQPGQTSDTYSVTQAQIQAIQGNPLNYSQKNLIRALPGSSYTVGQAPSIRGGRSNNVDYEMDGVPMINPYTNENVNNYTMPSFGLQSVQVSPGSEDASFGNSGVGTVNSVVRRGTYPGELDVIAGAGWLGFFHGLALGYGIASPNGRVSNYISYTAGNTAPQYGGNLEQNSTYNGSYGSLQLTEDREFTNNFVYNFGANNRYDVQYFTDIGWHKLAAGYGMGLDYNPGGDLNVPMCYATCNPAWTSYFGSDTAAGEQIYPYWCGNYTSVPSNPDNAPSQKICGDWTGLTTKEFQEFTAMYPGQTSADETLQGRSYFQEFLQNSAQKVAFDFRPDSSTLATLSYYNTSASDIQDSISIYPFTSGDVWNLQGGFEHSFNLDVTHQLNSQHLLKGGGAIYRETPVLETISPLTALFNPLFNGNFEYLDFVPNGQYCPGGSNGAGGVNPMPGAIFYPTYTSPITNKTTGVTYTNYTDSCGWIYSQPGFTNSGLIAPPAAINGNRIDPTGGSLYLSDTYTPSAQLKADYGVRVDYRNNQLPPAQVNPDCTTTYLPLQWNVYPANVYGSNGQLLHAQNFDTATGLLNGKPIGPGNCPTATFLPLNSEQTTPTTWEPRLALSYLMGRSDSLRFAYGRTMRYPNFVFQDSGVQWAPFAPYASLPTHLNSSDIVSFYGTSYALTSPNNYYNQHGIATTCGMQTYGFSVPCLNYGEQLYWNGWNGNFGKPLEPLAPITYNNFDLSYAHEFNGGWELKATPWSRRAYDLDVSSEVVNPYAVPKVNPDGTPAYSYFGLLSNAGIEIGNGFELYLTKVTPWHGLTGQISASFQHVVQNIDPADVPAGAARDVTGVQNNENEGAISEASAAFGGLYRVNYVTPFSSSFTLNYEQRGWRFQTQWFYDVGYPYGQGTQVLQVLGGEPKILPASNDCGNSSVQYADPTDPGSCLAPNIVANRGTNEGTFANDELTHPNLVAALTIEKDVGPGKIGFTVNNLFNEIYTGPTFPNGIDYGHTGPLLADSYGSNFIPGFELNPDYQPVAYGVSGPLSGQRPVGAPYNYGSLICGTCAYVHVPNGEGRTYYMYYQFKMGGH